jgi:hypothetical protein
MGVVLTRSEIEHIMGLSLDYKIEEKMIRIMENEQVSELVELAHKHDYEWRMSDDQRRWDEGHRNEKRMKEILKDYLWEDIEPLIKDEWRKKAVMAMI